MQFRSFAVVFGLLASFSLPTSADIDAKTQMALGNPDRATNSPADREKFLIRRDEYALSYNDVRRIPNWVAWHLNPSDIGKEERGKFKPDPLLPEGFLRVVTDDYKNTGYSRGHNCPSKDRSASRKSNDNVFFMTNITPQMQGMNAGPWGQLEDYCRKLVAGGNELYILCGHGFNSSNEKSIGPNQIAAPDFAWKIVVVLPDKKGEDMWRVDAETRVIAVKMPNTDSISKRKWTEFRVSVGELKKATGLKFLGALPVKITSKLKAKRDSAELPKRPLQMARTPISGKIGPRRAD